MKCDDGKQLEFLRRAHAGTVDEIMRREMYSDYAEKAAQLTRLFAIETQITTLLDARTSRDAAIIKAKRAVARTKKAEKDAAGKSAAPYRLRHADEPDNEYAPILPHLPVEVIEVEAIPKYVDHSFAETIQRRAECLIGWNYYSIDSSRRRASRRYEGYRR